MRRYTPPGDILLDPPPAPLQTSGPLAVVIPLASGRLSDEERFSLRLLARFLPDAPRFVIYADGEAPDLEGLGFVLNPLGAANFASLSAYNAMMLSPWFYEYFQGYRRILIYQTDCLILSGDIARWAEQPWSYLGAPFFRRNGALKSIGNGGFSLRDPAAHLAVLNSRRFTLDNLSEPLLRQAMKWTYFSRYIQLLEKAVVAAQTQDLSIADVFLASFDRGEDEFWSFFAPLLSSRFILPPPAEAIGFAAESEPARVVALNGGRPPLGVHAWARVDRPFWEDTMRTLGLEPPHDH